jgi:hypothetical protein
MTSSDTLSKQDFDLLFDIKGSLAKTAGPQASAVKMKNQ